MMKYDASKGKEMKKWWLKFTRRVDFCFSFEYRSPVLSRGTLIYRFDLELVVKRTHTNTCEPQKPLQNDILRVFSAKTGVSGSLAGMSGNNVRIIRTYTQSIRVLFHKQLVFVSEGINTPHTPSARGLLPIF
jgi:hypothetical protein